MFVCPGDEHQPTVCESAHPLRGIYASEGPVQRHHQVHTHLLMSLETCVCENNIINEHCIGHVFFVGEGERFSDLKKKNPENIQ